MSPSSHAPGGAKALREAFDRAFAEQPAGEREAREDLLALRVAGEPYAVRLDEVAALLAHKKVVSLPSPVPALLGIVGVRGDLVPVYSLRLLLGYPAGSEPAPWLLITRGQVGLAFDQFEGHLRLARSDISAAGEAPGPHVRQVAAVKGSLRSLVSIASLEESIRTRTDAESKSKER